MGYFSIQLRREEYGRKVTVVFGLVVVVSDDNDDDDDDEATTNPNCCKCNKVLSK